MLYFHMVFSRVQKILKLKLFDSDDGKRWRRNVVDKQYEILCISQFTLYHCMNGNKLDFHNAMPAASSEPFYNKFLETLRSQYKPELIKGNAFNISVFVNENKISFNFYSKRVVL